MRFEAQYPAPGASFAPFAAPSDESEKLSRREAVIRELRAQLSERAESAKHPERLYRLHAILNG